jgi:hypothetical protein
LPHKSWLIEPPGTQDMDRGEGDRYPSLGVIVGKEKGGLGTG